MNDASAPAVTGSVALVLLTKLLTDFQNANLVSENLPRPHVDVFGSSECII